MNLNRVGLFALSNIGCEAMQRSKALLLKRGLEAVTIDESNVHDVQLILVFGGDGTVLKCAKIAPGVPMLAINVGKVGFLSEIIESEINCSIERISAGNYHLEAHSLLRCEYGDTVDYCMNDCVIYKENFTSIMRCEVWVGDMKLNDIHGDGVVVCTPTGSTAYSLSAGGPLIMPESNIMCITPVCPHNMSVRPVALAMDACVKITMRSDALLSLDSIGAIRVRCDDVIRISGCDKKVKLVRLKLRNTFDVVRQKLTI